MILPQCRPQRESLVPEGGIDHHVRDMTATFAADVTLRTAQAKLAEQNQWLPIDGNPDATLGQLVETNSTGPLRLGYGAWRDLLLGCQFRNGRGELITSGGRTVKNVAGYDLTKFMIGQYGIFGKIVTITTRTYRRPEAALLAVFEPDVKRLNTVLMTPARPQWSLLTREALLLGYLGDERTIAFYPSELSSHHPRQLERQSLDDDSTLRARIFHVGNFRVAVPPASIEHFINVTQPTDFAADAAFGVIVGRAPNGGMDRIVQTAQSLGGSAALFDDSGRPIRLGYDPSAAELLRRLKVAFDPDRKLPPLPGGAS